MRHLQCLIRHQNQPKEAQSPPHLAQKVPKLALLLLVIFRHQNHTNQIVILKIRNQQPGPWQAFLKASFFDASPIAGFVLPSSSIQRHRRWLLFDFDDKRLARAFAHGAR
jgi:hypothetical protein